MQEIRRILCPIDFSESSRHALDHAVMIAGWYRATLTAVHVRHPALLVEPPILFAQMGSPSAVQTEDVEMRLHDWLGPVRGAGIHCEVLVADGNNPADQITRHAATLPAELIVIGTHGRSGFKRLLLGSVAERVVRTSSVPVVTVPPPSHATSRLPYSRVLCGIDFSEPSMAGLRLALSIARESAARLTLLHVMPVPSEHATLDPVPLDVSAFWSAVADDATRRLLELMTDEERERCSLVARVVHGGASEQILATAAAERDDLIVLGVHGRNALNLAIFGSTTNQVIRRATCPVLTRRR